MDSNLSELPEFDPVGVDEPGRGRFREGGPAQSGLAI